MNSSVPLSSENVLAAVKEDRQLRELKFFKDLVFAIFEAQYLEYVA